MKGGTPETVTYPPNMLEVSVVVPVVMMLFPMTYGTLTVILLF